MTTQPTIIDVLENALDGDLSPGRIESLSMTEVRTIREVVLEFYDAWAPYPAETGLLRVHLGGWVATNAGQGGTARDLLHAALLYAHQVVIHDPVAAYFEPRRRRLRAFPAVEGLGLNVDASAAQLERTGGYESFPDNLEGHRSNLARGVVSLAELTPLIREGVVVPIPHLKLTLQREQKIWTGVRHLLHDDDYLKLLRNPIDRPALSFDTGTKVQFLTDPRTSSDAKIQEFGDSAYYLARTLAMAEASYAAYMPPSATEWALYEQRIRRLPTDLSRRTRLDLTVAPALVSSDLVYFQGLSNRDLLAIREDEESFEHWRASLRRATRQISELPSEGEDFAAEARDVLTDHLDEAAGEVRQATSRRSALKRNLRPTGVSLSTGAAGVGGAAVTGGGPAGLAAVGVSGMLKWLADSLLSPSLGGTKAVLAHLIQPSTSETEDDWPAREPLVIRPK